MTPDSPSSKKSPSRPQPSSGSGPSARSGSQRSGEALDRASPEFVRKIPPQSIEAEQAVLGGVFLKNDVFHSLVDLLYEDDFYSPVHRVIYQAFQELYRQSVPIDLVTVAEHLKARGDLDQVGGPSYLAELATGVVNAANLTFYAEIVRKKAIQRRLINTSLDIINDTYESGDVETLLDEAEQRIFAISEARSKPAFKGSKELVDRVFEELTKRYERKELVTGVPTHYHDFDKMTAGLQPSDLIIVAGRPSMGKTAFAINVGMRAAINADIKTAVFSLEMSQEQLMMRMLCTRAKVDLGKFRRGFLEDEDWARLWHAADDLSRAPMWIDDTAALGTMEMRARCRRLKAEKGLDLVIVDYLQLMRATGGKTDSREQEISEISRTLKALAKELQIPVIALSQLNRKAEERGDKRPILSDLRESGAIEQDADVIIFLYRDEVYNKGEDNPKRGVAEIIIGKQRNGPIGTVELAYLGQYTAFENLDASGYPSESTAASPE